MWERVRGVSEQTMKAGCSGGGKRGTKLCPIDSIFIHREYVGGVMQLGKLVPQPAAVLDTDHTPQDILGAPPPGVGVGRSEERPRLSSRPTTAVKGCGRVPDCASPAAATWALKDSPGGTKCFERGREGGERLCPGHRRWEGRHLKR